VQGKIILLIENLEQKTGNLFLCTINLKFNFLLAQEHLVLLFLIYCSYWCMLLKTSSELEVEDRTS